MHEITWKNELITFYVIFCVVEECSWSERQRQLVSWAFNKWKYHKFTSLRVCFLLLNISTCMWCIIVCCSCSSFQYHSRANDWRDLSKDTSNETSREKCFDVFVCSIYSFVSVSLSVFTLLTLCLHIQANHLFYVLSLFAMCTIVSFFMFLSAFVAS